MAGARTQPGVSMYACLSFAEFLDNQPDYYYTQNIQNFQKYQTSAAFSDRLSSRELMNCPVKEEKEIAAGMDAARWM
jgi:hypothetical protein